MEFPRQDYWGGLSFPSPGGPPNPGIKPMSPAPLAGGFFTIKPPGKPPVLMGDNKTKNLKLFFKMVSSFKVETVIGKERLEQGRGESE